LHDALPIFSSVRDDSEGCAAGAGTGAQARQIEAGTPGVVEPCPHHVAVDMLAEWVVAPPPSRYCGDVDRPFQEIARRVHPGELVADRAAWLGPAYDILLDCVSHWLPAGDRGIRFVDLGGRGEPYHLAALEVGVDAGETNVLIHAVFVVGLLSQGSRRLVGVEHQLVARWS